MKTLIFLLLFSPTLCFAQKQGYVSLCTAYVPLHHNTGYLGAQLTVGAKNRQGIFLEYNQCVSLTSFVGAAKLFQLRGGKSFRLDRELSVSPFIGYSLNSAPVNENRKVGMGATFGCYIVQEIAKSDFSIKYELSCNNSFIIVPSIGFFTTF